MRIHDARATPGSSCDRADASARRRDRGREGCAGRPRTANAKPRTAYGPATDGDADRRHPRPCARASRPVPALPPSAARDTELRRGAESGEVQHAVEPERPRVRARSPRRSTKPVVRGGARTRRRHGVVSERATCSRSAAGVLRQFAASWCFERAGRRRPETTASSRRTSAGTTGVRAACRAGRPASL